METQLKPIVATMKEALRFGWKYKWPILIRTGVLNSIFFVLILLMGLAMGFGFPDANFDGYAFNFLFSAVGYILMGIASGAVLRKVFNVMSGKTDVMTKWPGDDIADIFHHNDLWKIGLISFLSTIVMFGATVLLIIPGIISIVPMWFVLVVAVAYPEKSIFEVFAYAFALIKGRWWKVLMRIIAPLLSIVVVLAAFVLAVFALLEIVDLVGGGEMLGIVGGVIIALSGVVLGALIIGPFIMSYIVMLFRNLEETFNRRGQDVFTPSFGTFLIVCILLGVPAFSFFQNLSDSFENDRGRYQNDPWELSDGDINYDDFYWSEDSGYEGY